MNNTMPSLPKEDAIKLNTAPRDKTYPKETVPLEDRLYWFSFGNKKKMNKQQ